MTRRLLALIATIALLPLTASGQASPWQAGKHYTVLPQPQPTNVARGKVEVLEVFSYGCPACNTFRPVMNQLKAALPANAQLAYLPASWNKAEAWPMFQRAYLTAVQLGVAEKAHESMYDAIWGTGELGVIEPGTRRLKTRLPTIEDAARFYERITGVKAADFVAASKTFGINLKMNQADRQINDMKVTGTPSIVVNGKYRLNNENLRTAAEFVDLVKYLVARESAAAPRPVAVKP